MKYIAPTLTALKSSTEIDVESCLRHYDFLIEGGIDGVAIFGSSGEFPHLPLEERKKLISAAVKHIDHRMQVFIGTGEMQVEDCIGLSEFALEQGADGVMIVGPYYFALNDESVFRYYDRVASAVKGKIYIYNYPERTGYSVSPEVVLRLAEKHPNIAGIKDTIPDMAHTVALIQTVKSRLPRFEVLSGFDYNFASNVMAGGDGCIAALSNIRPKLCAAWRDAMKNGDYDAAAKYQIIFNRLVAIYSVTSPFMAGMKSVLVDMDIFTSDTVCFPYQESTASQKQRVRDILKDF